MVLCVTVKRGLTGTVPSRGVRGRNDPFAEGQGFPRLPPTCDGTRWDEGGERGRWARAVGIAPVSAGPS